MPEILAISTSAWSLAIWTKDVVGAQEMLASTLKRRAHGPPMTPILRVSPPIAKQDLEINGKSALSVPAIADAVVEIPLAQPLFFENRDYEFDFLLRRPQKSAPTIKHRLKAVEAAFHVSGKSLRGTINFRNDVGWFKLRLVYHDGDREFEQSISLEVLPTKMDMASDLNAMHQAIDKQYPLWRFAVAQTTEQTVATSRKPHERFLLLWLAMFQSLRDALVSAVKTILDAPHSRLVPHKMHLRAERMKGRISARLEHAVSEKLANGELNRRYAVTRRNLTNDTPENRFVKMVLVRSGRTLGQLVNRLRQEDKAPDQQRLSATFFHELGKWQLDLERLAGRAFFADVGRFAGLSSESLVLHGRAGYSGVYRIWQQLKLYLDVFGSQASISLKSVEELYEVWCFLELRRILIEDLGFTETESTKAALYEKQLELQMHDGLGAAFRLERRDGVSIRLAHEPSFGKPTSEKKTSVNIYSWITEQKPDILLEATFATGEKLYWVFDAKYRIQPDKSDADSAEAIDLVPNNAINQMHRYRDALIQLHKPNGRREHKTRPILGAFALYPGWYDGGDDRNPYAQAIDEVGIGAFPLVPACDRHPPMWPANRWLRDFLAEKLGAAPMEDTRQNSTLDANYPGAARIAHVGAQAWRYDDLTLLVTGAPQDERTQDYRDKFMKGEAKHYHMRLWASTRENVEETVMQEIRYCAVTYWSEKHMRAAEYVYPVKSVSKQKRSDINAEQAGLERKGNHELYWLFELGESRKLERPIIHPLQRGHFMKLTSLAALDTKADWDSLPDRYAFIRTLRKD